MTGKFQIGKMYYFVAGETVDQFLGEDPDGGYMFLEILGDHKGSTYYTNNAPHLNYIELNTKLLEILYGIR